jgi:hypothetical protein
MEQEHWWFVAGIESFFVASASPPHEHEPAKNC